MTDAAEVSVGFDIGGTNLRAAVVTSDGDIVDRHAVPSPRTVAEMEDRIAQAVADISATHKVGAVGLALAAFLDPECTVVHFAPHLPWRNAPVRDILQDRLQVPVRLEHDANAAAWGEYRFGAAQGVGTWVLFAVGTGIGATLMIDGSIYRGAYGIAPEFGHLTVVPGGRACPCGKLGCLERYCSGSALVDSAVELIHRKRFPNSSFAAEVRRDPAAVTGTRVTQAARQGDVAALAVIEDFAGWLGQGFSIVADVLDPELIVLGGGVCRDADLFLEQADEAFRSKVVGTGYRPLARVATAKLGSDAGMIGVADLARDLMPPASQPAAAG